MSQTVTWKGTSYTIPDVGNSNWGSSLTDFLVALGQNASNSTFGLQAIRIATASPVTVSSATDFTVISNLTVAGAVAVNLPSGVAGQIFIIGDGKNDAGTNNITITPSGGQTINGAASLVLNHNRQFVIIQYSSTGTDWKVLANLLFPGSITPADITGVIPVNKGGTGQTSAVTAFDALSPLTTKGDIVTCDGTTNIRQPVGANGQVLSADSSQTSGLKWIDAPSGSGGINYIDNNDFESGTTTGWATYADAASSVPTDGTGGSPNVTFTANNVSPLDGNFDGKFSKDAVNRQGQGVAGLGVVPKAYVYGQKSRISFAWDGSATNYTAGDMVCYVYDVTNSVLITPTAVSLPKSKTVVSIAWDQSGTGASYRLIFHVATTNALAYDVYIDDVQFGPGTPEFGAVVSEPFAYVPILNSSSNVSVNTATWQQIGNTMRIVGEIQYSGVGAASALSVSLPTNYTIDTSKGTWSANATQVGTANWFDNGTDYNIASATYSNTTTIVFQLDQASGNLQSNSFASGDVFSYQFTVPISSFTGSGTFSGQNNVEYAFNTDTSSSNNDVAFGYGPGGQLFGAFSAGVSKRVQFQSPFQVGDELVVQYQAGGSGPWYDLTSADYDTGICPLQYQNTVTYGVGYRMPSYGSNYVTVRFGDYAAASGATYAAAGAAWSTLSTSRWRLKKVSAGNAVGFAIADSVNSGLLPAVTAMTDALATQLGYKQYLIGTAYPNGTPTLSSTPAGWSLTRGVLIPRQMQDGTWRLAVQLRGTWTSATSVSFTFSGVTTKNVASLNQPMAAAPLTTVAGTYGVWNPNSGVLSFVSEASQAGGSMWGEIELESKPTWAS